jgi:hypothetical protein
VMVSFDNQLKDFLLLVILFRLDSE